MNVNEMKMAEILATFNTIAEKHGLALVKRFSDLATAKKRLEKLIVETGENMTEESNEAAKAAEEAEAAAKAAEEEENQLAAQIAEKSKAGVKAGKTKKLNKEVVKVLKSKEEVAESISKSWSEKSVRESRMARIRIAAGAPGAEKKEYGSVLKAFEALNLDVKKHITFRGNLRKQGKAVFDGIEFEVVKIESAKDRAKASEALKAQKEKAKPKKKAKKVAEKKAA